LFVVDLKTAARPAFPGFKKLSFFLEKAFTSEGSFRYFDLNPIGEEDIMILNIFTARHMMSLLGSF
jgi:hypothetical protein